MGRLSLLGDFLDDDAEGLTGASDINEHGHVVGAASKYPDEVNPFVWDATAGMQDLGGVGGYYVDDMALNERGQVTAASKTSVLWSRSSPSSTQTSELAGPTRLRVVIDERHHGRPEVGWRWQPSRTRRVSTCTCRSRGSGRCAPAGGG
jgi:probable HAF family extracellular repeat protein